ncbi:hypothetical protein [Frankia sp. AgPm24]|uniref:hypothetical protein n=1 Tax=Frankia sp. AgPm24 TaxID=631128 RepID=UPI00200CEF9C|nr:hypothetical protein [Frankia sp. AgPm24]
MTTAAIERVAEALRVTPEVLMFGGRETAPAGVRLSFDLAAVRAAPAPGADPLRRWLMWVAAIRGDRGGRVLTVRGDDLRVLAILHDTTPAVLIATFTGWGVLLPSVDEDDGEAQQ